ncbi:3-deoxy-7-phosphoheptulonate synthase [bacterium]|nr:3-deoxy-7-phosphoheptulonate synthase [bacterium]MBU1153639.1 3-deoxy-7-phosphoheptulonate synthase [bacterium]MBU1782412.1 3-deoxy-7-phosphoheptulonate synthase [bacterium]MBU2599434.1 3-deoxy-7-phosphoheptulonate synthase [bacterium]
MIIVLKPGATQEQIDHIAERLSKVGLKHHVSKGSERTIIGVIGDDRILSAYPLEAVPGIEKVLPILKPYKLASRDFKPEKTTINIDNKVTIGGDTLVIIGGPCSVESEEQILSAAKAVKEAGAHILRGGAFKPRTSPYDFQGLGKEGLKYLASASQETGLPIITEVMDPREVDLVVQYASIIQIGARNMQNYSLLKEVGACKKPILLKRGLSATIKDLLMSAEYILSSGNPEVILCERGIRTFVEVTRNTLDISAVPVIKELSHLPIIVDPSHAGGNWKWVAPLSKASVAAGCDGLLIEVHPNPEEAYSDGEQSLTPTKFINLINELKPLVKLMGKII